MFLHDTCAHVYICQVFFMSIIHVLIIIIASLHFFFLLIIQQQVHNFTRYKNNFFRQEVIGTRCTAGGIMPHTLSKMMIHILLKIRNVAKGQHYQINIYI